jgi:hypothetical protein
MDGGILNGNATFIKDNLAILILLFTALGYIFFWFLNEWSKRSDRENRRKEERYKKLINGLSGYVEPGDTKLQNEFKNELNLCWLYCPDDVIRKATDFYVKVGMNAADRSDAAGELLIAIRRDAMRRRPRWYDWLIELIPRFRRTTLRPEDYREKPLRIVSLKGSIPTRSGAGAKLNSKPSNGKKKKGWWQFWK